MAELSPEEKQRIYVEEKARLEAKEQLKPGKTKGTLKGCLTSIGIFFAFIILINVLVPSKQPEPPSPEEIAQSEKKAAVKLVDCEKKLEQAQKLEVLYDLKFKGANIIAYVGPTWFRMPIDAKEGFHNTLQCVLTSGKGGAVTTLEYRHWQSGKVVANTSWSGKFEVTP